MIATGPPGASANGHNENRALFKYGHSATWIDAISAVGAVRHPETSTVAEVTGFSHAPMQGTSDRKGWFWSCVLATPARS
jgi:multiple sugar transport system substrate-binding protein/sorbitol/mannitol transport system substrate-binding protein